MKEKVIPLHSHVVCTIDIADLFLVAVRIKCHFGFGIATCLQHHLDES